MASFGRSARPRLIEPQGYASAARAELAVAIAKRETAKAHLAQIETATSDLWGRRRKAQAEMEAAQTAVDAAKEAEAANVVDGTDAGQSGLPAARAALAAAQDRLDLLVRAERLEPGKKEEAEKAIAEAIAAVKKAVLPVLREHPFVSGMLDRLEGLEREYLRLAGAFNCLVAQNAILNMNDWGGKLDDWQSKRAREVSFRTFAAPQNWTFANPPEPGPYADQTSVKAYDLLNASAAPWVEAFRELQNDANAPLPTLPK